MIILEEFIFLMTKWVHLLCISRVCDVDSLILTCSCFIQAVATWMATRKLKQLGIPTDVTFGYHQRGQDNYRFMVMPRYGSDLEKVFDDRGRKFSATVAFSVALKVVGDGCHVVFTFVCYGGLSESSSQFQ